jgi:hypothetical protein
MHTSTHTNTHAGAFVQKTVSGGGMLGGPRRVDKHIVRANGATVDKHRVSVCVCVCVRERERESVLCVHACMSTCVNVDMCLCVNVRKYERTCACVNACMYVCV